MTNNKKLEIKELKDRPIIAVMGRFTGDLKNRILSDIEKGEDGAKLLRKMAKEYYHNKDNTPKSSNSY